MCCKCVFFKTDEFYTISCSLWHSLALTEMIQVAGSGAIISKVGNKSPWSLLISIPSKIHNLVLFWMLITRDCLWHASLCKELSAPFKPFQMIIPNSKCPQCFAIFTFFFFGLVNPATCMNGVTTYFII